MISLHISRQGERLFSLILDQNMIRLGRSSLCEVCLDDPTLSRVHCSLQFKDGHWLLVDESKNGIFFDSGEKIIDRVRIQEKKEYKIGRIFTLSTEIKSQRTGDAERTVLIHQKSTQVLSLDPKSKKFLLERAELHWTNAEGEKRKTMVTSELNIGSHTSCDVLFPKESVSQFHARINLIQNQYFLSDLGSTNGTLLDDVQVMKAVLHKNSDLQIGNHRLQFVLQKEEVKLEPKADNHFMGMVSANAKMKKIFSMLEIAAPTDAPVFISGETGTGKELMARALHDLSPRYDKPFIAINCASLPKDLIESELFGHEKGAFTGAQGIRIGAIEAAHEGTLFLDEVAELDQNLQAKLLRALESGEIKRLGSNDLIQVNVRLVSATHKDLVREVHYERFREDLFFRLHVIPLHLPPLRDRPEDLQILVPHLLKRLHYPYEMDADVLKVLRTYSFPGNIRELKNILQRAALQYQLDAANRTTKSKSNSIQEPILKASHFDFLKKISPIRPIKNHDLQTGRDEIERLLEKYANNQSEVSRILGIPISTLHDRIKRYGLGAKKKSSNY